MSSESSTVVKRTIKRTVVSSNSSGEEHVDRGGSHIVRQYQVYRGLSPDASSRLEIKIRELEEAMEREREGRLRAEKELSEVCFQLDSLNERLEEADGLSSAQSEINRRREQELVKIKKDFELFTIQHDTSEASLRKRHQEAINDLTDQLEQLSRNKAKSDKDKQQIAIELESALTMFETANKAKLHLEEKMGGLEDALRRLKPQADELARYNQELNGLKARLTQENYELHRQVQELDSSNATLSKTKTVLQQQLDEAKALLDEESRLRGQSSSQLVNLQVDFDNLSARIDEEAEANASLRGQLQRTQTEYTNLKSKYEKELVVITEELEEHKRKTTARIAELEDLADQARNRAVKLEKDRSKLVIEIRDLNVAYEEVNLNNQELQKRLKQAEHSNMEYQKRIDELMIALQSTGEENKRLNGDLSRIKVLISELQLKIEGLARENKQLSDALREALKQNKDLGAQIQELRDLKIQLEAERQNLASEVIDLREALKDAETRLASANASLSQIRVELENRIREKDEELDNIRKGSARAMDELQRTISEVETKYKSEIVRLRKKYENEVREYEIQIETLNRSNAELAKANKAMAGRIKELEGILEDERVKGEQARQVAVILERKRISLQTELEDVRSALEAAERARKNAESAVGDTTIRVSELSVTITNISNDKRRLESEISALQSDLEEAQNFRRAAEERADRMQAELNRLSEEHRQEQDNFRHADQVRKQLEVELRQVATRLEQAETFAQREGKRMVDKLSARLRDLETELEAEQRRGRDVISENRKLQRLLQEQRTQAEDAIRHTAELTDQINQLHIRVKTLKRQLEEAEEVVIITMNKYRKAHQMLEESAHHAESSESTFVQHGTNKTGNRSMSVTREVTRVVRV